MSDNLPAAAALAWEEKKRLYREVIARLEVAVGPDQALDRDICRLLRDGDAIDVTDSCGFTSDLPLVLEQLRKSFPRGGWRVLEGPELDVLIWEDGPSEAQSEFFSTAWRDDAGGTYMRHPPANLPIAYTLALLRAMGELFDS